MSLVVLIEAVRRVGRLRARAVYFLAEVLFVVLKINKFIYKKYSMKSLSRVAPVLLSVAFLFSASAAAAAPAPQPVATTLTVAPATGVYGGSVTLTATLTHSVGGGPVVGKTIVFTLNGFPVGSAVTTAPNGTATLTNIPTLGLINAGVHPNYIKAVFLGAPGFAGDNDSSTLTLTQKVLTVTGITASNKSYDGTTAATIDVTHAHRSGVVLLDQVNLNTSGAVGNFTDPNVGTGKTVNITGITLTGHDAANYTLSTP